MPTYNNALTDQPANRLAYPGGLAKRGGSLDSFVPLDYSRLAAGQFRQDTPQMREYAANVPVDVMRGRLAGMLGFPSDVLNMFRTPSPMEMFGQTDYEQPTQVPYGSEQFLKTLPLAPAENNPLGRVANRAGSLVPFTPMEALQAARMARQAAMATGKFVAPKAAQLTEGYMQRMGMMPSIVPVEGAGVASAANLAGPEVASANQLAAFTKPKAEVSPLGFYSAVEQQALNIPRKSGTGASFINDLMKGQDVKKYEIEAMGLDEFLKGKPNVSKEEVQNFIANNRIDVQERQLGNAITEDPVGIAKRKAVFDKYEPQIQALDQEMQQYETNIINARNLASKNLMEANAALNKENLFGSQPIPTTEDYFRYNLAKAESERVNKIPLNLREFRQRSDVLHDARDAEANAAYVVPEPTPTKYDKYQLPGGDNYREILLKLPTTENVIEQWMVYRPNGASIGGYASEEYAKRAAKEVGGTYKQGESLRADTGYRSSHWSEPNVLAHMRVNDRIDADGKKMLLVEEVQSDWHQAGRERGYASAIDKKALENELKSVAKERDDLVAELSEQEQKNGFLSPEMQQRWDQFKQKEDLLRQKNKDFSSQPPDAPFKDTWYQLALKRAIKEAVDKGYDRIGLTTGKQQAERYKLSKQISEVHYSGTNFKAYDHNGEAVINETGVKPEDLAGMIGKEAAKKLLDQPKQGTLQSLTGQNLDVGGEGMKKYYDEIYPAFLEKQGKKYGAKMGETRIKAGRGAPGGEPVRYLDITPEMRDAVKKGQPLASMQNELANRLA